MITWQQAEELWRSLDRKFVGWTMGQQAAYDLWEGQQLMTMLLFFPTGKGKTKTALSLLADRGEKEVVVIAPPRTQLQWKMDAMALGMSIRTDSHAKFRMKDTQYKKNVPIIVDEFHLLGSHTGMGWKKFNRMAWSLQAPILMLSATPNYNDAERVFCLTAIGDSTPNRNYLQWLYDNCTTKPNYFSAIPEVTGFKNYDSALAFLVDLPWVSYIEDDAVWEVDSMQMHNYVDPVFEQYGYSKRDHKIVASDMEKFHKRVNQQFITSRGLIRPEIMKQIWANVVSDDRRVWLIFCSHKTVAEALYRTMNQPETPTGLIHGDMTDEQIERNKNAFIKGEGERYLVGTATLATGVDGIDKVCQSLLILDDVRGDGALRRQLIGRILPRGGDDGINRLVVTATIV